MPPFVKLDFGVIKRFGNRLKKTYKENLIRNGFFNFKIMWRTVKRQSYQDIITRLHSVTRRWQRMQINRHIIDYCLISVFMWNNSWLTVWSSPIPSVNIIIIVCMFCCVRSFSLYKNALTYRNKWSINNLFLL